MEGEDEHYLEEEVLGHELTRTRRQKGTSTAATTNNNPAAAFNGGEDPSVFQSENDLNAANTKNKNNVEMHIPGAAAEAEPEPEPEPTDGQSVNSVYLDKENGTWKCHHCTWTYPIGSPGLDHSENIKEHSHKLMNFKMIRQQEPFLSVGNKGFVSINGRVAKEIIEVDASDFPPNGSNSKKTLTIGINQQAHENLKEGEQSVHLLLSERSTENGTAMPLDKNDRIRAVKEGEQDFVKWDVEKVLEEQDTHDLFCPKCNSCITKRVILRKRKRRGQNIGDDSRPSKIEILDKSSAPRIDNKGTNTDEYPLDGNMPLSANDQDHDAGPFIFRCLSCFSFFIPAVAGCKLFKIFREKREDIDVQHTQQIHTSDVMSEQEITESELTHGESAGGAQKHSEKSHAMVEKHEEDVPLKSQIVSDNIWFSPRLEPVVTGAGQKAKGAVEKRSPGMEQEFGAANGNDEPKLHRVPAAPLPGDAYIGEQADDPKLEQEPSQPQDTLINVEKNFGGYQGDHITIVVDKRQSARGVVNDTFSSEPSILEGDQTEPILDENRVDGTRRVHKLEIVKSIVYGGLIESITSLVVVSSAAGGDASTLNILALGLANLVGGLPIIAHSLGELKNEQHDGARQSNEIDRYLEVLGQRRNFWVHAVVAVLSYLVFGIVPIVTYGFSFRKSDNKEYKLIAVAVASLFCIVLLSIGKAYVRKPPKLYFKTIVNFVVAGVMASGLSYVVGVLVKELLEKLGLFESSAAASAPPSMSFFEVIPRNPVWASH